MTYSQKYTIVQFLEPIREQQVFSMDEWPLHITLADVFAIELNESLLDHLTIFLTSKKSLTTESIGESILGSREKPITVTLLKNTDELQELHTRLIDFLEDRGALFNTPQFTKEGFLPHSSHQSHTRLHNGEQVSIHELSLVDMFVDKNWKLRKVIRNFKLEA